MNMHVLTPNCGIVMRVFQKHHPFTHSLQSVFETHHDIIV